MASFVPAFLLLLLTLMGGTRPSVSQSTDSADPMCHDWGVFSKGAVSALEGEAAWLSCPLFSHPSVYNYSTQSTGHNLFWYQILEGQDLEQPIRQSSRFCKQRERLWVLPAEAEDSGQYICLLRNKSSCSKIAMRLKVLRRGQATPASSCEPSVAPAPTTALIPLQEGKTLDCPGLKDAASMSDSSPTVNWSHKCNQHPFWNSDRQQRESSLRFYTMVDQYQGLYYCTVHFQRGGKQLNFTRAINVTAINPTRMSKTPVILHPYTDRVFHVKSHSRATLACQAKVPFVVEDPSWDVWWTVDGQTLEKLNDHRFSQSSRVLKDDHMDLTVENVLEIQDFQTEDLQRRFNCSVKNAKGFESRRAVLEEEASLPSVELGCGLGVTLVLMLLLFVVYHVFWLELLLLYRSWFGTDERHTDEKDFDVYISYARNGEEEQFVLSTLRGVLENEFGYSVCIFDRDSLPGGNLSDAILQSMQRSRRLLFVFSPAFLMEKSFSLLECRLGLYLQRGRQASIVGVVYRSVSKVAGVEVSQLRQVCVSTVTWRGARSEPRSSRFWLRLRLALPVRPLALGRRMIDSTSSHSDLAALALQRVQRIQSCNRAGRANQNHRNRRTSSSLSHRDQRALARGRGSLRRTGTPVGQVLEHRSSDLGTAEDRREELKSETEHQEDQTAGLETDSSPMPANDAGSSPNHAPFPDTHPKGQYEDPTNRDQNQQLICSRRSGESSY
ncbi:interleukin-1 receptor accessory protein isoform X1 [Oryzias melastigma]|uniref:Interleukin 1 receptor accessory protein n=1 Tax=Oryzias melastigma TaxID=30732 RepID=A0A3B3CJS8_ORYME|nr:interleukin-1 receptor accessory protein isoform X1 [Oryzias melastigma]